jgi:hypothetical protein
MISMIRNVVKLVFVTVLAAVLPAAPSHAENFAFVSATGSGTACTAAAPCASVGAALFTINQPVRVICLNGSALDNNGLIFSQSNIFVDVDCPQGFIANLNFSSTVTNSTVKMQHVGFRYGGFPLFVFLGSGTLILDDCLFGDSPGAGLDIEPNGPLNLVIRNSRISNNASGMLLKPASGGSIKATFDHVVITGHNGGGIKVDTSNGPVTVDVTDGEISNNGGNGLNAVGGAGGPAIFNIHNSVIAKNAVAGVQVNGATAAAMIDTTLLDSNASGATSVVGGGHMLTYGNNRIVGTAGSGFTGSAPLQ